jgi:outer membrane protein assembly factor BamB
MDTPKKDKFTAQEAPWRVAAMVSALAGLFCVVMCALLIANYVQIRWADPLDNPELITLRQQLADSTETEDEVVQKIRGLDFLVRKAFFTSQVQLRMGGHLLLAGAIVFLIAYRLAARWKPATPHPDERGPVAVYWAVTAQVREYVLAAAGVIVLLALAAAYWGELRIPAPAPIEVATEETKTPPADTPPVETVPALPTWEDMQRQWPSLRGPGNIGVAYDDNAPTSWDVESGTNIRWKVEAPEGGFNSTVVWDDRLYLSSATDTVRSVYCYDTETGDLRWKQDLPAFPGTPAEAPDVAPDTGHAAASMVVHGDLACAIFANGDVACYRPDGALAWGRNIGQPDNHYGHASSLIAYAKFLYVQLDDSKEPRVTALDIATGEEAWSTPRKKISWASPALIKTEWGMQLVLNSERDVDAYNPETGELLWTLKCLDGEVAPSPAYADGIVFVANEYAMATAIQLSEADGVLQAELAWEYDYILPEIASPLATATHFYMLSSMGSMVCLDRESGETVWEHEVDDGFHASPVLAGERVYAIDNVGMAHIFKANVPAYESIAEIPFNEEVHATPAILDGRIYLRTEKHLLCIEAK